MINVPITFDEAFGRDKEVESLVDKILFAEES